MFEPDSSAYEYHINIQSVKMKVKFPCRMKIEKEGSLLTGEVSPSDDSRYLFNQSVILKDQSQRDCFQLTINLLTDKGAKYIGGIIKLYHSELIRSQGERITLSLSKCIDSEAFCEIKVEQVVSLRAMNVISLDRKNIFQRQGPVRVQDISDFEYSPKRGNNQKIKQSKTEFQFPLRNQGVSHDWAMKSKSPIQAPKTVYGKSKIGPKVNYLNQQHVGNQNLQTKQSNLQREKALQAQIYKEGYQKLKQKYKKQTEVNKQQLNKRLALQNSENNLKLQIMRFKLKCDQQQKSGNDKSLKIKEMQAQINFLQQKQVQNGYLHQQINKKDQTIRSLEDRIRVMNKNIDQMREYSADKTAEETSRIKQLQSELENLKIKMQEKQRQLQKQNRAIVQTLHQRELELKSSTDNLQRQRKVINDLEKGLQNKNIEMEKTIQNEKNNWKTKLDLQKSKNEKLQKEISHFEYQKKETARELQQIKTTVFKTDYQKKIVNQQFDVIKSQYIELKSFKQKYNELMRQHRDTIEQNTHLQRQLQKTIQNKQVVLSQANKQFQDQLQYYKRNNRELDQKVKTLSNKLIEIQGQLQLSRNQQDKIRRNFQASIKESAEAKEKEKTARKTLKSKQQQTVSLESEYATLKQKLKSIDQIYKLQIDKAKDEAEKYKSQFESELQKGEQLTENKRQLSIEISQIKIKLQYADERAEKDATNLKEKQNQLQALIKDHDEQISVLDQNLMNLRLSQKQLSTKIQKYEIQNIKLEDRVDKYQKDIKIFEERCNNYENNIKNKIMETQVIMRDKQSLQKNLRSVQFELNQLKTQYLQSINERNKYIKMSELLQQQNLKLKENINLDLDRLAEKDKIQESLKNQIKNQKDIYASLDLKLSGFKKQTERNRQILLNTIQKCLMSIPLPNRQEGKKNQDFVFMSKESQNSFSQAFSLIINQSKQIRISLQRQQDQIKQMKQQNQRLQEDMLLLNNQSQNLSETLHKQIQELDNQLRETRQQKQYESMELNTAIEELTNKIDQLQLIQDDLNTQLEELNFANNSLKMDYEAFTEQSNKKIANLKKVNTELQEKVQEQTQSISQLDQKSNNLEKQIDNLSLQLQAEKEGTIKRDKQITELKDNNQVQSLQLEELKKIRKEMTQNISELELYLNAERQINEKQKVQINQQQKKLLELKVFISNLMKQKQIAIKSELEGSESIINLENQLLQTQKQLQVLKQENSRTIKALEIQKEVNKKVQANVKQLQNDKQQQKIRHVKTQQKLRDKQKQLVNREEAAKKMEQKYQKMIEKYKTELKQMEEQLTFKNHSSLEQSKDSNQRYIALETQLQRKSTTIITLQAKIVEFEEQLYSQRQRNSVSQELVRKLTNESQQLRIKVNQMDINLSELIDECKTKEQKLFQLSGEKYALERARDEKERQFKEAIEILNSDWDNKCDSVREQYEQKIQFVQKERQYFKKLNEEKQKQNIKVNNLIKKMEIQEINTRKSFQDKMQKIEEQKLSLLSLKNGQIQRLVEESRTLSDNFKTKESQLRRNANQLEIAKKSISNLDHKLKQYDEKIKGINKVYQSQIEQLKKKDIGYKSFKEAINNHQWHSQREAKKSIQSFIKNFLELSEDKNSQKIIDLVRSLQKTILQILSSKPIEK